MKNLYLLLGILICAASVNAQLTVTATAVTPTICLGNSTTLNAAASPVTYTVSSIPENSYLADGTNYLAQAGVAVTPLTFGSLDDGRWDNITLPFAFKFYGNTYTTVNISTNGWVAMGSTSSTATGYSASLPNAAAPNEVVHAISSDLTFAGTSNLAELEYFTAGTAPNRVFVVRYANLKFVSSPGTADVQVMLYEGSNIVEVHTGSCTNTGLTKSQGLENAAGNVVALAGTRNVATTWTGTPNAYRFTPSTINYTWSPSTGLSGTTGASVTASPTTTQTYTVNAVNPSSGATGSANVTVTVSPASYTLAATAGGAQICRNISVGTGSTYYRDGNCNLIATITPSGANPVSNSINTCTKVDTGATKRLTADLYVGRKYDIEPIINPATSTATITLYYLQTEFDNFNKKASDSGQKSLPTNSADATGISNLILRQCHGTGTAPGNYSGATQDFFSTTAGFSVIWNSTRNWWEVTVPVTGFSGFYITSKKSTVLGIKLDYFKGSEAAAKNTLNWKVNCTSNKATMELQRSGDGINYTTINTIVADQARCGQPFDYTDNNIVNDINYYRLKIIDVDGKSDYGNTVVLTNKTKRTELVSLAPSVVTTQNSILKINSLEKKEITIVVSDFTGRVLKQQKVQLQAGGNQVVIMTDRLTAGTYLICAFAEGEKPQSLKLIKQ